MNFYVVLNLTAPFMANFSCEALGSIPGVLLLLSLRMSRSLELEVESLKGEILRGFGYGRMYVAGLGSLL
jgi:hypothetical protein